MRKRTRQGARETKAQDWNSYFTVAPGQGQQVAKQYWMQPKIIHNMIRITANVRTQLPWSQKREISRDTDCSPQLRTIKYDHILNLLKCTEVQFIN